jgi:hypothetical protein
MWIYNSLCTLVPAAIFIIVCFVPTTVPIVTIVLFICSNTAVGLNGGGYYRCCCLVARFVISIIKIFN